MGIRVLGTLDDLDLGSEGDLGADLEAGALVCLPGEDSWRSRRHGHCQWPKPSFRLCW